MEEQLSPRVRPSHGESAPEAALEEAGDAQCLSSWELSLQTEIR